MKTQFSKFKLYLEGHLVNFNSATIRETGFTPATCVIVLPGNANSIHILPGTIAQLFYDWGDGFKIIFEGELTGKSFNKIATRENVQLSFSSIGAILNRSYKTAVASLTTEAKHLGGFVLLDSSSDKVFSFPSPEMQAVVDSYENSLTGLKKYFETTAKGLEDKDEKLIEEAIFGIFEDAERLNEWFGYFSNAYKFKERLLVFPNTEALSAIYAQVSDIFNRRRIAPLGNLVTFTQILYRVLEHIGYAMVFAACPQYGADRKKTFVYLAANDYLAPIKCNTFFGNSVQGAGFSQSLTEEPTRLAITSSPINFLLQNAPLPLTIRPTFFAPKLLGDREDIKDGKIDFSNTEQLIGIIPSRTTLEGIEAAYANVAAYKDRIHNDAPTQKEVNTAKEAGDKSLRIVKEAAVTDHIKKIAQREYWDLKYKPRQLSISVPYNPKRMAGFAGLFIDENMPMLVGVIKSIDTQISADGSAVSTISLIKPRIIPEWDETLEDFEFSDQFPKLDAWFDPDTFNFENIGAKVYNKILGISSDEDASSIFTFKNLKEYEDLAFVSPAQSILDDESHPHSNTAKISKIATAVKNFYIKLDVDQQQRFEDSVVNRELMSEEEYWNFLLSSFDKIDEERKNNDVNNYEQSDIYRDLNSEDDTISIKNESYDNYKPYVLKRLNFVRKINA